MADYGVAKDGGGISPGEVRGPSTPTIEPPIRNLPPAIAVPLPARRPVYGPVGSLWEQLQRQYPNPMPMPMNSPLYLELMNRQQ